MRSINNSGQCYTQLICSESKVAPLKVQSLSRLELCAAVLLTKLFNTLQWVSEIQQLADNVHWRHVPSQDNPANCLSRGIRPADFLHETSWFTGPQWLRQSEDKWPSNTLLPVEVSERRTVVVLTATVISNKTFIDRFSSLGRLERTIAYCLRFCFNIKHKQKRSGLLSVEELQNAQQSIIKFIQQKEFVEDIKLICNKKQPYNGKLRFLNPFVDKNGILRLFVMSTGSISTQVYQMGNLPKTRVTPNRAFLVTGIDYCSPLYIKEKRLRNTKTIKVYVVVFVCFSTKAVHLELVSDLTTEAFLAVLKRFFARRGKSSEIYSDNAKTFIDANRELREIHESFKTAIKNSIVQHYAIDNRIIWHFIPPRASNFGGLWEATVKQVKRHLIRTVGKTLLTYEAMTMHPDRCRRRRRSTRGRVFPSHSVSPIVEIWSKTHCS
ncbi:uncharacterized protein LOC143187782 [Calliopsis andreniformis]|uniref:uncharacterized protein LOC143187782 n=1 Tax=Calliopsis andreniformis TaxID=337506 RepID=UPI003FCD5668